MTATSPSQIFFPDIELSVTRNALTLFGETSPSMNSGSANEELSNASGSNPLRSVKPGDLKRRWCDDFGPPDVEFNVPFSRLRCSSLAPRDALMCFAIPAFDETPSSRAMSGTKARSHDHRYIE
jgi:hypothetical protein